MQVFFSDADCRMYLQSLREQGDRFGLEFLAYCLMSNHVHLVVVPRELHSLARGIGEAHRRYTRMVNFRQRKRGYLFQGRFFSCVLDEPHLLAATRYVELNPVRARMHAEAWHYRWSSCRYHLNLRKKDVLVTDRYLAGLVTNWRVFLRTDDKFQEDVRRKTRTGRPCAHEDVVRRLEQRLGRRLLLKKPGRPPKMK